MENNESGYYANQPNPSNLVSRLSLRVRQKMFAKLMEITQATAETKVLDIGVTSNRREESNFLEKMYPYRNAVVAVGLEDAAFLEQEYPGIHYVRADGKELPFEKRSFDLVTGFAVIEHAGARHEQQQLVREMCRVGKSVIITTPNRWHPMEVHTMMPLLHWLPAKNFRAVLRAMGKNFYAEEANLNLLDADALRGMFPSGMHVTQHHFRLFGMVSNLFYYAKWE